MPDVHSSPAPRYPYLGDIIIDLNRLRGITIDVPDDSVPREYVGLRDQPSPTDKGKSKARQHPPPTASASNPQDVGAASTASVTSQKRRREEGEGDNEEKAAYEARLRTYDPAAPRVSSFLSGPPFVPEPGVSRRVPPQDYRAPPLEAVSSTGSEAATMSIDADLQRTDMTNSMRMATLETQANDLPSGVGSGGNLPPSLADARGPFDHMNLTGGSNTAEIPRSTPWFPSRVRPFDYLATTGSSEDTGPIQPTYQQSMHSSRGFTSFPTFSSNTPFSGPIFPTLDIPPHPSHSTLHSAVEGGSFPTSASSLLSSYLPAGWENPPLDHNPQLEPRYPHIYVTFGAGVLQKEIDMYTADNPVEAKESANSTVGLIPYHVPTYAHSCASTPPFV